MPHPNTLAARIDAHPMLTRASLAKIAGCCRQDVTHYLNQRREKVGRDARRRIEDVLIRNGIINRKSPRERTREQYLEFHRMGRRCLR